jgi:predicted DNA binding CopG/RHH family protein
MNKPDCIEPTTQGEGDAWESGKLGREEQHQQTESAEFKKEIDDAVGLQPISIRLQKDLLDELKMIANYRSIGYQPLIRDVLSRWARAEIKQIASELQEQLKAKESIVAELEQRRKRA